MKKVLCTLYGMGVFMISANAQTYFGLTKGDSKIVKYDVSNNTFQDVFSLGKDSAWYNDLLLVGTKLYGLTAGGTVNFGTLFSFEPATSKYEKLHDFDSVKGKYPHGSLVRASDGKLYGMTESGGVNDKGVIFSFDLNLPPNNAYKVLHDFGADNGMNGSHPFGSLLLIGNKLYGMTESGGDGTGINETEGFGVVFSYDINASSNGYQKLVDFNGDNGRSPYGSLIQAKDELLYGMTKFGGTNGFGVIFSFDPKNSQFTKHVNFNWNNGAWPNGSLVQANDTLYGVTEAGGGKNHGVLFTLFPGNNIIEGVYDIDDSTTGRFPLGSLVKGSDGKLYGMTESGGDNDNGVFFSYDLSTFSFAPKSFNAGAVASSLTEVIDEALPVDIINFTVRNSNQGVQLKWITEEIDIEKYEVERSGDGIRFSSLGFVSAMNVSGRVEYNFTDKHPLAGNNFYRLKIHEQRGAPHYSNVKVITSHIPEFTTVLQPNPVSNTGQLKVVTEKPLTLHLKLVDQHGRIMKQWHKRTFEAGQHYIPLEVKPLASGAYHLILESSKGKKVIHLAKADQ